MFMFSKNILMLSAAADFQTLRKHNFVFREPRCSLQDFVVILLNIHSLMDKDMIMMSISEEGHHVSDSSQ